MRGDAGCFPKRQHWEGKGKWGHRTDIRVVREVRGIVRGQTEKNTCPNNIIMLSILAY